MHTINFSNIQPYLFCVSGLIFIFFALFKKTKTNSTVATERTEGTIFELHGNINPDDYNSIAEDKIIVKFVTKHKEWITAPIKNQAGTYNPHKYKIGDKVNITYNPYNPTDFIIETKQSEKIARIFIAIVGFLFFAIGLLQILM